MQERQMHLNKINPPLTRGGAAFVLPVLLVLRHEGRNEGSLPKDGGVFVIVAMQRLRLSENLPFASLFPSFRFARRGSWRV